MLKSRKVALVVAGISLIGLAGQALTPQQQKQQPATAPKAAPSAAPIALPAKLGVGREATTTEVAGWDIDVRPDGQGLPPGKGTVAQGEVIYQAQCAACHGEFGEGKDRWPELAGFQGTVQWRVTFPAADRYELRTLSGLQLLVGAEGRPWMVSSPMTLASDQATMSPY